MARLLSDGHKHLDADYWAAYLAATIGGALVTDLEMARSSLKNALREFTKARACSDELRATLEKIRRGERTL